MQRYHHWYMDPSLNIIDLDDDKIFIKWIIVTD